ncbi:hypothetical protein FKM82_000181 [Ascaphus truei]
MLTNQISEASEMDGIMVEQKSDHPKGFSIKNGPKHILLVERRKSVPRLKRESIGGSASFYPQVYVEGIESCPHLSVLSGRQYVRMCIKLSLSG